MWASFNTCGTSDLISIHRGNWIYLWGPLRVAGGGVWWNLQCRPDPVRAPYWGQSLFWASRSPIYQSHLPILDMGSPLPRGGLIHALLDLHLPRTLMPRKSISAPSGSAVLRSSNSFSAPSLAPFSGTTYSSPNLPHPATSVPSSTVLLPLPVTPFPLPLSVWRLTLLLPHHVSSRPSPSLLGGSLSCHPLNAARLLPSGPISLCPCTPMLCSVTVFPSRPPAPSVLSVLAPSPVPSAVSKTG